MTTPAPPLAASSPETPARASVPEASFGVWSGWLDQIEQALRESGARPQRAVVLVPYAQLMEVGRLAWAQRHPSGFAPRFESSRNWAQTLMPPAPAPTDLHMTMAHDSLVAAAFIDRVTPRRMDAALRAVMVTRLVEAARQLAPMAAARPPEQRQAWADSLRESIAPRPHALHWEALLQSLALAWAGSSGYATDVLWSDLAAPGADADLLLVLPGFQPDLLVEALTQRWGHQARVLQREPSRLPAAPLPGLHACDDAEDEAQRAAACVLLRVQAGETPVALVANDRLLTRRVSAILSSAGVAVHDETGWKLSTTRAAARLMSLLRAASPRARMDDVLDWLKQSPLWSESEVQALEQWAREGGVSRWRAEVALAAGVCPAGLPDLLDALRSPRPLADWLLALTRALEASGLWSPLQTDAAGQQILRALRLGPDAPQSLHTLAQALLPESEAGSARAPVSTLASFTAWVREVLEGESFQPRSSTAAEVVTLPLAQLLGRSVGAVVIPGCDETHLSPSPEPPGHWTSAQREAIGLPSREALALAASQAWHSALRQPRVDVLWRTQERGETWLPGAWVQALDAVQAGPVADPRGLRVLVPAPQPRPLPSAPDLLPDALSASAYQDLRHCPYRFFALRQLRLQDAPELEAEPDQRDLGNWLHAVLRAFHEARGDQRPGLQADRAALDAHAQRTTEAMGLQAGDGEAGFMPYLATWPALRDGYLTWLAGFEAAEGAAGPRFLKAEQALTRRVESWTLLGKLDRIDEQPSPEGAIPIVIDYKTESRAKTLARVKQPLEDTQLAFYAALLQTDTLRAAYLSITDSRDGDATSLIEQPEILPAREQLLTGLVRDLTRIATGARLPALGEGAVCDFCAARGLCRKDQWGAP